MAQVNFTLNMEDIQTLIQTSGANDFAKQMLTVLFNQLMEAERDEFLDVARFERNEARQTSRNGYYNRQYTTRIGTLELHVPRTRDGQFHPTIFEKYQRSEQALVLAMLEMVISGVSTRKVTKTVETLTGGHTVSKSQVSAMIKKLTPIVEAWRNRSLEEVNYPFIMSDAIYTKVRVDHRVVSKGIYITVGVDENGTRRILGFDVLNGESDENWTTVFEGLKERGLHGVKMITSDAHIGLTKAIQKCFMGASWQRCQAHFIRNIFDKLPKHTTQDIKDDLKSIFNAETIKVARERKNRFMKQAEENSKLKKAADCLEDGFEDSMQIMTLPQNLRKRLRTSNMLERLNEEVRRRERVVRIFPNVDSVIRIIGTVLQEKDEEWQGVTKKYLDIHMSEL